jgi:energy-coupling factor transporter ATP-binding protein EcfA2
MSDSLQILSFQPVALRVADLGPFQGGAVEVVDFTDDDDQPCNLYMLLSGNGRGKTTLFEGLVYLVGLLQPQRPADTPTPRWLLDNRRARLQLDVRVSMRRGLATHTLLLSILANGEGGDELEFWDSEKLAKVGCGSWARFGYTEGHRAPVSPKALYPTTEGPDWQAELHRALGDAVDGQPSGFEDPVALAPTVLFFTANRDIMPTSGDERRRLAMPDDWGWSLVRRIDQEGGVWFSSPDNLLVWMAWLDDGRLERAQALINERVFKGRPKFLQGVRKTPPEAIVVNEGQEHRLDQLSSGERAMVQLVLRLGAHMTRNTWLIVDEVDLHLHPRWEHRMMRILKELASAQPGLTILVTSQSRELLQAFAYHLPETGRGLRKGGHFIERDLDTTDEEEA